MNSFGKGVKFPEVNVNCRLEDLTKGRNPPAWYTLTGFAKICFISAYFTSDCPAAVLPGLDGVVGDAFQDLREPMERIDIVDLEGTKKGKSKVSQSFINESSELIILNIVLLKLEYASFDNNTIRSNCFNCAGFKYFKAKNQRQIWGAESFVAIKPMIL